jgi:flagellar biosynthesis protein FlhF
VRPAAPEARVAVFRPVAIETRPSSPASEDALGAAASPLIRRLVQRGVGLAFAERLIAGAREHAGEACDLAAAALADLRVVLPAPAPLPTTGAIAVVGPAGAGKTRVVAALAAAHARAGHGVSVARLGAAERSHELAELLSQEAVEVVPAMRTRATVRAVGSARERGLVIVDTTSAAASDSAAIEVLAETLAPFALDGVLLAVPATMTARAITKLAAGFAPLAPTELVATHVDEAESLGTVAEAAIVAGIPLGHATSGLVVSSAISELEPAALAEDLLR